MTGGNGFVGNHLRAALANKLSALSSLLIAGREPECDVFLELSDAGSVESAVRSVRPDLIIHLGGEASVAAASRDAINAWRINVAGTLALAATFGDCSPAGTFFFISSAEVYGGAALESPATETIPASPISVYGKSKLAAEWMLSSALPSAARLITVRPSNHLGPGQDTRFAIPSFARQIAEGEQADRAVSIKVGNLDARRDFMDVRDVVRAYVALLMLPWAPGTRATYNVASGVTRGVGEIMGMLQSHATVATSLEFDPDRQRANELPSMHVDASLLRAATGWSPLYAIEQTVADILGDARQSVHN